MRMSEIDLFFKLPSHLLTWVVVDWLEVQDVARMDTAVCNVRLRKDFSMAVYGQQEGAFCGDNIVLNKTRNWSGELGALYTDWIFKKGARSTALALSTRLKFPSKETWQRIGSTIKTLILYEAIVLSFSQPTFEWKNLFADACKHCPNVERVEILGIFNNEYYSQIGAAWPGIRWLKVGFPLSLAAASALQAHFNQLTGLDLTDANCSREMTAWLHSFFAQKGVQLLHLVGPFGIQPEVAAPLLRCIVEHCCNLQSWKIVVDSAEPLLGIITHCPQLHDLDLIYGQTVATDQEHLINIAQRVTSLTIQCTHIRVQQMAIFVQTCTNLRSLDISNCCHNDVLVATTIAQNCGKLQRLRWGNSSDTDAGVMAVAEGCPDLREVALPREISNTALTALMTHCPKLTHLDTRRSPEITHVALRLLPQLCPHLVELSIAAHEEQCSTEDLLVIAKGCRKLRALNATGKYGHAVGSMVLRKARGFCPDDLQSEMQLIGF